MGDGKARKIIFIDKRFQGEFILKFVLLLLVGTAVFVLAAYLILDRRLEDTYYSAHVAIKSTGEVLLPTLLALSGVFIVVLGAAAFVITLYVSHHIAGPLYAIRRYLENVSRGDLDFKPKLRLNDQTTPLAESLAHALETLNARLVAVRIGADADARVLGEALAPHGRLRGRERRVPQGPGRTARAGRGPDPGAGVLPPADAGRKSLKRPLSRLMRAPALLVAAVLLVASPGRRRARAQPARFREGRLHPLPHHRPRAGARPAAQRLPQGHRRPLPGVPRRVPRGQHQPPRRDPPVDESPRRPAPERGAARSPASPATTPTPST